MQNYGECQHFIFDNPFKPIEIEIDQPAAPDLYKTHLYIGEKEFDEVKTNGPIRTYKLNGVTIFVEDIRRSVSTW